MNGINKHENKISDSEKKKNKNKMSWFLKS